jgi:hypothetical protein
MLTMSLKVLWLGKSLYLLGFILENLSLDDGI